MIHNMPDILAFLQVMQTGSISAAAQHLQLAKSVVSKRINALETQLGVALFYRSNRRMVPTERAITFAERVCSIIRDLDEAAEDVATGADDLRGELRIAAPTTFGKMWLGPLLIPFIARHPNLQVILHLDDRVFQTQGEGYDVAIRMARGRGLSLVTRKLGVSRRLVCCSPEYAARFGLPTSIDKIAQHACIGYANMPPGLVWQFDSRSRGGKTRTITVRNRFVTNHTELVRDAAIAGLGLAVIPLFAAVDALRDGRLIDALPGAHPTADTIFAIRPPMRHVPKKVRTTIDYLVQALGGVPPWERVPEEPRSRRVVAIGR